MVPSSYLRGITIEICCSSLVVTNSSEMVVERACGKAVHDGMSDSELQVQQKWPKSARLGGHVPPSIPRRSRQIACGLPHTIDVQ